MYTPAVKFMTWSWPFKTRKDKVTYLVQRCMSHSAEVIKMVPGRQQVCGYEAGLIIKFIIRRRLKTRDLKTRHGQKRRGENRGSRKRGTRTHAYFYYYY